MLRIFLPQPFVSGATVALPVGAARHVQVLRQQPGQTIALFNGADGCDWPAEIVRIGRNAVEVRVGAARAVDRELACEVTLALGVPANDRMDALVEKAGELGATAVQPLVCERSVVRLAGDRAEAKRRHWQAVAAAASEQCGRARVTEILPLQTLSNWLDVDRVDGPTQRRVVLSLAPSALAPTQAFGAVAGAACLKAVVLSGPEGGLTAAEESAACQAGFTPVGLGPRTLRADTAPLALLAWIAVAAAASRRSD